jgi:hypothetical protein
MNTGTSGMVSTTMRAETQSATRIRTPTTAGMTTAETRAGRYLV